MVYFDGFFFRGGYGFFVGGGGQWFDPYIGCFSSKSTVEATHYKSVDADQLSVDS